jgi:hypothetical protein
MLIKRFFKIPIYDEKIREVKDLSLLNNNYYYLFVLKNIGTKIAKKYLQLFKIVFSQVWFKSYRNLIVKQQDKQT